MALEGTHIKFAVDVMDKNDIQDTKAYISGAVYPDSRYVTKIERILTHDISCYEKKNGQDDFGKGWQSHLFCDNVQKKLILDILDEKDKIMRQGSDLWVDVTAIKVLQEISDLKNFDVKKYLKYIEPISRPNDEDEEKLKGYFRALKDFYSKDNIEINDYSSIFLAFGISDDVKDKVLTQCVKFQADKLKIKKIEELYSQILLIAHE